jgi:hypothetical protein
MAKRGRRKSKRSSRSHEINWRFDAEVPVNDVLAHVKGQSYGYELALPDLIYDIQSGYYLQWEAVIRQEQGLPLTSAQKASIGGLLNFGDDDEDRILYIDGIPRPKEPWYEIAGKIVPRIIHEPFRTEEGTSEAIFEGWPALVETLEEHGKYLTLPADVQKPIEIFPLELRHLFQLHLCCDALSGLGQEEELTLANPEQREYRIEWFLRCIREHKDTIQYFELSLETLLTRMIMPPQDEEIFIRLMTEELGLPSTQALLAEYL